MRISIQLVQHMQIYVARVQEHHNTQKQFNPYPLALPWEKPAFLLAFAFTLPAFCLWEDSARSLISDVTLCTGADCWVDGSAHPPWPECPLWPTPPKIHLVLQIYNSKPYLQETQGINQESRLTKSQSIIKCLSIMKNNSNTYGNQKQLHHHARKWTWATWVLH